jgi:hypothetical protein
MMMTTSPFAPSKPSILPSASSRRFFSTLSTTTSSIDGLAQTKAYGTSTHSTCLDKSDLSRPASAKRKRSEEEEEDSKQKRKEVTNEVIQSKQQQPTKDVFKLHATIHLLSIHNWTIHLCNLVTDYMGNSFSTLWLVRPFSMVRESHSNAYSSKEEAEEDLYAHKCEFIETILNTKELRAGWFISGIFIPQFGKHIQGCYQTVYGCPRNIVDEMESILWIEFSTAKQQRCSGPVEAILFDS